MEARWLGRSPAVPVNTPPGAGRCGVTPKSSEQSWEAPANQGPAQDGAGAALASLQGHQDSRQDQEQPVLCLRWASYQTRLDLDASV